MIEPCPRSSKNYKTTRDIKVMNPSDPQKMDVIPAGFRFDGASIPRAFWSTIGCPFHPRFVRAALVHDFYCRTKLCNRKDADKRFYEMLREAGVARWRAKLMYRAVRVYSKTQGD